MKGKGVLSDDVARVAWDHIRAAHIHDILLVPSGTPFLWQYRLTAVTHAYHFANDSLIFRSFDENKFVINEAAEVISNRPTD